MIIYLPLSPTIKLFISIMPRITLRISTRVNNQRFHGTSVVHVTDDFADAYVERNMGNKRIFENVATVECRQSVRVYENREVTCTVYVEWRGEGEMDAVYLAEEFHRIISAEFEV